MTHEIRGAYVVSGVPYLVCLCGRSVRVNAPYTGNEEWERHLWSVNNPDVGLKPQLILDEPLKVQS